MTLSHGQLSSEDGDESNRVEHTVIWDRKTEGGFPETKELKNRVRNIIEPGRNLGHIDRSLQKGKAEQSEQKVDEVGGGGIATAVSGSVTSNPAKQDNCEDCK